MIYIYQLETMDEKAQQGLLAAAKKCEQAVGILTHAEFDKTVEQCLTDIEAIDMNDFTPSAQVEGDPFLIMDVGDLELDGFLAAMKEEGVRIPHKCMVTETNRSWTIEKVVTDVTTEHVLVQNLMQLQQMVKAAKGFNQSEYNPLDWVFFTQALNQAEDLLAHADKVPLTNPMVLGVMDNLNQKVVTMLRAKDEK